MRTSAPMFVKRISLIVATAALGALLSGCEALQAQKSAAAPAAANQPAAPTTPAAPANAATTPNGAPQTAPAAAQAQGAAVFFLLAQPEKAPGLNELKVTGGSLWYLSRPVLTREDLTQVTPLLEKDGKGLVRFDFNLTGAKKLADLRQKFAGKYFIVVVGHSPVSAQRIAGTANQGAMFVIEVPSAAQAQAITRDIAGQHH